MVILSAPKSVNWWEQILCIVVFSSYLFWLFLKNVPPIGLMPISQSVFICIDAFSPSWLDFAHSEQLTIDYLRFWRAGIIKFNRISNLSEVDTFENLKWRDLLLSLSHKYLMSNLKWDATACKCELDVCLFEQGPLLREAFFKLNGLKLSWFKYYCQISSDWKKDAKSQM